MKTFDNCYLASHSGRVLLSAASLFGLLATSAQVAASTTVCVRDVTGFQDALNIAYGSTTSTFIEVVRGTYHLNGAELAFPASTPSNQGQLDVTGGYSSDCSTLIRDPSLTIFDGGGLSPVMYLQSAGGISVRYLTIQNGGSSSIYQASGLTVTSINGGVIVNYNIFRNNSGPYNPGLEATIDDASGALHVDGNLVVGNTAVQSSAVSVVNLGSGATYVTNNTISANISMSGGASGLDVQGSSTPGSTYVSNNIAWGNENSDLNMFNAPVLVDNDFGSTHGTADASSSGNLSVDPQFASSSNFHLLATSPLLGAGTLTPAGNLPTIDIEGHPRSYNGLVDMGAYERGDKIYADGFDH